MLAALLTNQPMGGGPKPTPEWREQMDARTKKWEYPEARLERLIMAEDEELLEVIMLAARLVLDDGKIVH